MELVSYYLIKIYCWSKNYS